MFPLDKYDVISENLGWLSLLVPTPLIDFQSNYIQKRLDENKPLKESPSGSVTSRSNEASNIELNFISGCQEIKDLLLGFLKQARLPTMIGHN